MPVLPARSAGDLADVLDYSNIRSALTTEHLNTAGNEHAEAIKQGDATTNTDRILRANRLGGVREIGWREATSQYELNNAGALGAAGSSAIITASTLTANLPDASTTIKGVAKLSVAPVSATDPISVGNNDTRMLTQAQKDDLTDAGDSTAHYHAADRARVNHTGTQIRSTISDFAHAAAHGPSGADDMSATYLPKAGTAVGLGGAMSGAVDMGGYALNNVLLDLRGVDPGPAVEGQVWYNTGSNAPRAGTALGPAGPVCEFSNNTGESVEISNTAVETDFSVTFSVPANALATRTRLRLYFGGKYSTTGTITLTFRLYYGTALLASTGATTTKTDASDDAWEVEARTTITLDGASGEAQTVIRGTVSSGVGTSNTGTRYAVSAPDTTGAATLKLSVQMSVASVSNKIRMMLYHRDMSG